MQNNQPVKQAKQTNEITSETASRMIITNLRDYIMNEFKNHKELSNFIAEFKLNEIDNFSYQVFCDGVNAILRPKIADLKSMITKMSSKYDIKLKDEQMNFIEEHLFLILELTK